MTGIGSFSSSERSYDGHIITSRTMPTMSVAVAIISPGSGVKSTVISIRLPRGRTPTPVERRFAPASITGTGRMYASSSASFLMLRFAVLLRFRDLVARCCSGCCTP